MTLYESIAAQPDGRRRLAAAEARYSALEVLFEALDKSGLSRKELADRLGLRKSAVSEVFGGNGNLRVNTLSDYLFECGFTLRLAACPLEHDGWTDMDLSWGSEDGVQIHRMTVSHPQTETLLGATVVGVLQETPATWVGGAEASDYAQQVARGVAGEGERVNA